MNINTENASADIKKNRPNLKDNTIKQYEMLLNKLKKLFESDNYDFLKKPKDIEEKLSGNAYTSVRNTYNAIIVLLNALNSENKYDDLIKEYSEMRDKLNDKYDTEQKSGTISDKQKNNFVELSEIESMLKKMEYDIKERDIKKKKNLTSANRQLLMVYVIYNMLIRIPTRNDFAGMQYISKSQYNKLIDSEKEKTNFLVKDKNKLFFVYNQYKTSKKYGEKLIDSPPELTKILNMYIKVMHKKFYDVLFTTGTGNPLSRNAGTQLLIKHSKKYIGKSISTTMIRKIVVSNKFGEGTEFAKLKEEQEELANKMGHSVNVMNKVYIKEKD